MIGNLIKKSDKYLPSGGNVTGVRGVDIIKGKYFTINDVTVIDVVFKTNESFTQYSIIATLDSNVVPKVYLYDTVGNMYYIDEYKQLCTYKEGGLTADTTYTIRCII